MDFCTTLNIYSTESSSKIRTWLLDGSGLQSADEKNAGVEKRQREMNLHPDERADI